MANDPKNQEQFAKDVAAAAALGDGSSFANIDGSPMPSVESVLELINQIEGLSAEDRAELRASVMSSANYEAKQLLNNYASSPEHTSWDYIIFMTMIGIIVLVFGLFGYKLYKSLMEKEQRKQEKLRLKQGKKSKKIN